MADKHPLKSLYRDIEAGTNEMAAYRENLAEKLDLAKPVRRFAWWPALVAPAIVLMFWVTLAPKTPSWQNVEQLDTLLQSTQEAERQVLYRQAQQTISSKDGLPAANARALLVITMESESKAIALASEGLSSEPRPEFRQFYLEWLLDRWDRYQWNTERYEALMEQENDPLCLALYATFLESA
jgi:hypothetical protein